jgi:hypothetical protein
MGVVGKIQSAEQTGETVPLSREDALTEVRRLVAEGLASGGRQSFASEGDFLAEIERLASAKRG